LREGGYSIAFRDVGGVILTSVVNHQYVKVPVGLGQDRFNRTAYGLGSVINRDSNRNPTH